VRELRCACGNRLVAQNDQELTREVLTHAHTVHPEMDLTEEQAKILVVSQASDTEEALEQREKLVRQLLRNFPNGSVNVFDRDLRYVLAEGQGLRQEGLSPEMLVGKTLHELFPKESADFVMPYYQRAFAGEDVEFELPLGENVYSIHAAPLHEEGDEVRTIIAVAQNITETRRAEEERDHLRTREIEARTQKEERRRIARDLHDVVLQDLAGVLQSLRLTYLQSKGSGLRLNLEEELEALGRATLGLRSAIHDLRGEKERPFVPSVEALVQQHRHFSIRVPDRVGCRGRVPERPSW
jgi:PAS domain S-box-containing protein